MSQPAKQTRTWELAGLIAALIIVVALPLYYFLVVKQPVEKPVIGDEAGFVGSLSCKDCHEPEFENWQGSHHDLAMDTAHADSVLGDFNDAEFSLHDITSRFYMKGDKYFVYTNGPGGEMGEFEITHTFGWFPLQQYLVPFPGGRLQTLPIAWDSRENRWFRVPPEGPIDPDDWLYWTNAAQNWNGMCAQCHSTNLKKNFDPATNSYNTTWSEIDVGCEACHGPGSSHVEWAEIPEMARPESATFELRRQTSNIESAELVEICAPCHSRRATLSDDDHTGVNLLDTYSPSLLNENLYFADGQIEDEVYVYGSFIQSKMYRHEVRCSDCHEVHSIKLVLEGNALCLQCHRAAQYDTRDHHFHKQEGETGEAIVSADGEVLFEVGSGAKCVECHMPGRVYMGNDYRPDHGFRIPDPAMNEEIGSPDACLRCHQSETSEWSQQQVHDWYGPGRKGHYGYVLAKARNGDMEAGPELRQLASDVLYPINVRATALAHLSAYPGEETLQVLMTAMQDEDAMIRRTAVETIDSADRPGIAKMIAAALYDPVKAVRTAAANRLAGELSSHLDTAQLKVFQQALNEYVEVMTYSADFAASRHNLANLYGNLDRPEDALKQYQQAIRIDDRFYPSKMNLAVLLSQRGENQQAEKLLREVIASEPELYEASYSLGLLLVELQNYPEGVSFLENAAQGMPGHARVRYNLGLMNAFLQKPAAAEKWLQEALKIEPLNLDFQYGLADFYLKRGQYEQARKMAEVMVRTHPENPIGQQILEFIRSNTGG